MYVLIRIITGKTEEEIGAEKKNVPKEVTKAVKQPSQNSFIAIFLILC